MKINPIQSNFNKLNFQGKIKGRKVDVNPLRFLLSDKEYQKLAKQLEEEYHITPYTPEKKNPLTISLFKNFKNSLSK